MNDFDNKRLNTMKDKDIIKRLLKYAIPFIGREKVQAIYNAAEKGEIPGFNSAMCIPFLGADKIKELFRELVQKANDEPDEEDDDDDDEDDDI